MVGGPLTQACPQAHFPTADAHEWRGHVGRKQNPRRLPIESPQENKEDAMRNRALLSAFALAVLLPACGDSDSGTAPVLLDSGVAPLPDAAPVVSPFVPAAIEGAINQLVAACEAKALPSAQKPPIAV